MPMLQCKEFQTKSVAQIFCRMYGLAVMLTISIPKLRPLIQIVCSRDQIDCSFKIVFNSFYVALTVVKTHFKVGLSVSLMNKCIVFQRICRIFLCSFFFCFQKCSTCFALKVCSTNLRLRYILKTNSFYASISCLLGRANFPNP